MLKSFNLNNSLYIFLVIFFSAFFQTNPAAQTPENQTEINERFELNIVLERITEIDFLRSTDVRLANETDNGVQIEIGVSARAEQINVLLRGITGRVNFRASLESIRRRIGERRQNAPANQPLPR